MRLIYIETARVHTKSVSFILKVHQQKGLMLTSSVFVLNLPNFKEIAATSLQPMTVLAANMCVHILGIRQADQKLVFLHKNSWVSSIDLRTPNTPHYTQHFFVLSEFLTNSGDILPMLTVDDRLAAIKNGLKFSELMTFA